MKTLLANDTRACASDKRRPSMCVVSRLPLPEPLTASQIFRCSFSSAGATSDILTPTAFSPTPRCENIDKEENSGSRTTNHCIPKSKIANAQNKNTQYHICVSDSQGKRYLQIQATTPEWSETLVQNNLHSRMYRIQDLMQ